MKTVTVVFKVRDVHNIEERKQELEEELRSVQNHSEVGLQYQFFVITDFKKGAKPNK